MAGCSAEDRERCSKAFQLGMARSHWSDKQKREWTAKIENPRVKKAAQAGMRIGK